MNNNLTSGPVFKTIVKFCWPLMLANLLLTLYNLTDMMMAGRFIGKEAMSAVSAGGQMTYLLTTLSMGLAAGGQILASQQKGAGLPNKIPETAGSLFIFSAVSGILFSFGGFMLTGTVLKLLNTPPEAFDQAVLYMKIASWSLMFVFGHNAISGLFRGLGESRIPLYIAAVSAILNLAANFIFLKFLKTGILGIALGGIISQCASFVLAFTLLYKNRGKLGFELRQLRPSTVTLLKILKIGIPFGTQLAVVSLANMYITAEVNHFGVSASAALGAGVRFTNLLTVPMMAAGNGASTMIGQSMGSGNPVRASKAVKCALAFMLCISAISIALCQFWPQKLIGMFHDDKEVIETGALYLRTVSWSFIGHSCHSAFNAAALGVGFSAYSLFASVSEALLGRVLLTYLLGKALGLCGIFLAQAASPYISGFISGVYYYSGRWKRHNLPLNE